MKVLVESFKRATLATCIYNRFSTGLGFSGTARFVVFVISERLKRPKRSRMRLGHIPFPLEFMLSP